MKFKLKKLFGFALVILLIWTVYTIFFSKIIEGEITHDERCKQFSNTNQTTCHNNRCTWISAKPEQPYIPRNGRMPAQQARSAQPAQCRWL